MAVQYTPLGTLNRLVASVIFPDFPQLNVTPPFLTRRSIGINPEGDATLFINVLTGMVTSPEPYMGVTVTLNLNRTLPISAIWQAQWLTTTLLGACTVRPDVAASQGGLQPFDLLNVGISRVGGIGMDGEDATLQISLKATYILNSLLWTQA